jgi:hypothetical protein
MIYPKWTVDRSHGLAPKWVYFFSEVVLKPYRGFICVALSIGRKVKVSLAR